MGIPGEHKPSTLTADYQRDWPEYFNAVQGQPPRDTLMRALDRFQADPQTAASGPMLAVDLACGQGRDTLEILSRTAPRWRVIATDYHPEAVKRTLSALPFDDLQRVMVCQVSMEELPERGATTIPPRVDLFNASFALPFCRPESFPALWRFIGSRLRPGGRFCGQFFGDRDQWRSVRPQSHYSRAQVEALLQPFAVEHMEEVEKDGSDAMGGTKHHHVFHVVARKL